MTKNFTLSLAFLIFSAFSCFAQQESVNWVNEHALPINSTDQRYLEYLRDHLKDNQVLGLAEASHGTHEFFTEKNRIIKYLITNAQYRSVGFEASYSYIAPINNYVLTGKGNLKQLMKPLRLYNTSELYQLFQLIKAYNIAQQPKNKVSVFGFDRDFLKPEVDISALYCRNYLSKKGQHYTNAKAAIPVFKHIALPDGQNELSDNEVAVIRALYDEVKADLTNEDSRLFKKYLSMQYQSTFAGDPLSRDRFMAENIADVQQQDKAKTIILAHNVHMAKDTTLGYQAMGNHLKQKYQERWR